MSKYRYREVKNYIHNELKLTKEDIREIMIPIIREEVKRVFHNTYGNDVSLDNWIRCTRQVGVSLIILYHTI